MEWPSFPSFEEWLARRKLWMGEVEPDSELRHEYSIQGISRLFWNLDHQVGSCKFEFDPSVLEDVQNYAQQRQQLKMFYQQRGCKLLGEFAWRRFCTEEIAATFILRNREDFGREMGISDPIVLEDVENYAKHVLRRHRHKMIVEHLLLKISNCAPLVEHVVTDGQSGFIHGQRDPGAGLLSPLLHHHCTAQVENTATDGSQRWFLYDGGDSDSTASVENHHSAVCQFLNVNSRERYSCMDRSPHLTQTGRGFSRNISPQAHGMMLDNTHAMGDGEAGGWNNIGVGLPAFLDVGGSSQKHDWSAEAHPTAGAGRGGNTGAHTIIDIPAFLLQSVYFVGEELRETDSENDWASRILETTIGTLLPAAAVNARDFFSAASDIVQLAGNMMLPALLGLCFIGMVHKRRAGRILRLATCAAIAATTLGVSSQLPEGIYIFIAAVAGVALSFITLTA